METWAFGMDSVQWKDLNSACVSDQKANYWRNSKGEFVTLLITEVRHTTKFLVPCKCIPTHASCKEAPSCSLILASGPLPPQ